MKEMLFEQFATLLGAIIAGVTGFIFGRKRQLTEIAGMSADNEGKEIENADKLVNMYKGVIDDLGERYEAKFKAITDLYENKVQLLNDEIEIHKRIVNSLKSENTILKAKLKEHNIN